MSTWTRAGSVVLSVALISGVLGCATTDSKKEKKPKAGKRETVALPSKVKFGEFKNVEIKPFGMSEKYSRNEGNKKSAMVMDGMIQPDLRGIFPNLKVLTAGADFTKSAQRTLQITPYIEEIKKVSSATRVMVGVMAGGSHIIVRVTYRDGATGEVIADPVFVYKVSGWTDAWGMEGNQLRDRLCNHIVNYTRDNK